MNKVNEAKESVILALLEEAYPVFKGGLTNFSSPFQMLVATILSAQSTDKQVNSITEELFSMYPDQHSFAKATLEEIEHAISKVGLFRNKAKSISAMSKKIISDYDSEIPRTVDELIKLPGVGRKTANVLLNDWFEIHDGIAVDTHVKRISYRLGFTEYTNPDKIEFDLMKIIPQEKWGRITHLLISHGRVICKAPTPKCQECFLLDYCPRVGVEDSKN
ncbi:MAG: endonuclease III [Candidatus Heimdallarchaeota archaeon]|nr:endonuclease III [Candidatus Heimdallarchaeota archaeon]